ncbi:MAG: hypothetical protein IJJ80_05870 [Clostridia bacterium]|nr:hypothetical protein [Clostridia bacterium]
MAFTPPKKEKLTGILAIIVYLVSGLLMLIKPDIINELTRWALTIVLGGYAIIKIVQYFRTEPAEAAKGYSLTAALIAGTLAVVACLNTGWLTYRLWGLLILFGGYMKFQTAWDFFRLGHQRWWWILIGTAISFLFGILIAAGVVPADVTVWFGIALLIEAALDITVQIMVAKGDKWNAERKPKEAAPAQESELATESAPASEPAPTAEPAAEAEPAPEQTPVPEAEQTPEKTDEA